LQSYRMSVEEHQNKVLANIKEAINIKYYNINNLVTIITNKKL